MKNYGLTEAKARTLLKKYGKNEIKRTKRITPLEMFISQFKSPLIIILILAAVVSMALSIMQMEHASLFDSMLIVAIVVISCIAGFLQDYKAERTVEALQKLAVPLAKVVRDGKEKLIKAVYLVPGDLIIVEAGDIVPADAKIVEEFDLMLDESILTGESRAVKKKVGQTIYMNSAVVMGSAKAIVEKTGMDTKLGQIAAKLQTIAKEKTLFEQEMEKFGRKIFIVIVAIIILLFLVGLTKYGIFLTLLLAISLAVAAIPEGLPAVVTTSLAIAANSMAKQNALVRRLGVIESIGAVDVICADKTGTITKNEMTVVKLFFGNSIYNPKRINSKDLKNFEWLAITNILCNNAKVIYDERKNRKIIGDPTEVALLNFAQRFKLSKEYLERIFTKVGEISFTSERKMMSVIYKKDSKYYLFSKGAPEVLIEKCNRIYENGKIKKLTKAKKEEILAINRKFASKALRVLGFAFKEETKLGEAKKEDCLAWLALEAMEDPPRENVKEALLECRNAGIRVIMLTGDNPLTAKAIANEINLSSSAVITGKEIDKMSDEQLRAELDKGVNIFARVSPFHKLRILEVLQSQGKRVAMTGDGVNDALALKKADIGISMGIKGTEVAKEASDIILLDDNFATIRNAVREGRRIFDNIKKFVNYLFTCNIAEVLVIFSATIFLTLKEPILLPIQILWINLLTDGMPALALGIDPARPDIMQKPPRKKGEGVLDKRNILLITTIGLKKSAMLMLIFFLTLANGLEIARSALFSGFILYEFVRIASIRYQEKLGWLSNKWLLFALIVSVIAQLIILYTPISELFHVVALGMYEWIILIVGAIIGYILAIAITWAIVRFSQRENQKAIKTKITYH
ncbi:MAG: cation-translocating P-type ATPase [Candidatus Diapherotrites archaeon]|nr:cation-translocating P-type ATPase [Candidatus Diapherotrites archaeon]